MIRTSSDDPIANKILLSDKLYSIISSALTNYKVTPYGVSFQNRGSCLANGYGGIVNGITSALLSDQDIIITWSNPSGKPEIPDYPDLLKMSPTEIDLAMQRIFKDEELGSPYGAVFDAFGFGNGISRDDLKMFIYMLYAVYQHTCVEIKVGSE